MNENLSPSTQLLDFDGLSLALWHYPAKSQNPIKARRALFLHGYFDTARSYDSVIAKLDGDVECYALDFRGHGRSARVGAGGSYHLFDYLKDAAFALQTIASETHPIDVLVGHSMGGNVALLLAAALPRHLKSLVLIDNVGGPSEEEVEQPRRLSHFLRQMLVPKRDLSSCADTHEAALKIQTNNFGMSFDGALRMAQYMVVPTADGVVEFLFDKRLKGPTPLRFSEAFWRAFCSAVLASTTLIRAEHGYLLEDGLEMQRLGCFQKMSAITFKDVGHHIHVEAPAQLADHLNRILQDT